jgi:hypothetical protein
VGGFLLVIIVIAVAAGGSGEATPTRVGTKTEARPVDVSGLEREGMAKCDEGLVIIQRCKELMTGRALDGGEKARLKADLERGVRLIQDGSNMLDEANTKSGHMYDVSRHHKASKAARMKLGELGGR